MKPPLILASASRGRADLLRAAGFAFEQIPTGIPEPPPRPGEEPRLHARRLARLKAAAAVRRHPPGRLILAADTVVACDGLLLGKPADPADAVDMLIRLGGRPHLIVSALCLATRPPRGATRFAAGEESAFVTLRCWPRRRLIRHVALVKPLFCAGAYALQEGGLALVERIDGDPSTVVGLPLGLLARLLRQLSLPS